MANNQHIEISIKLNPSFSEIAADFLVQKFNCGGVITEETYYKDLEIISEVKDVVKGYYWNNPQRPLTEDEIIEIIKEKHQELKELGFSEKELGEWEVSFKVVKEEDWAHSWKNFWHPQKIGSKLVIAPSWEEYNLSDDEMLLELDPGSAFGTGTHATTKLCILALEKYLQQNSQLADIGIGSGILSLAGLKFGARFVQGVDNDPLVIEVAKENAQKNDLLERTNFYEGTAKDVDGKFDFVCANILHNVLIDIMEDLQKLIKQDGMIVLSGIIKEKEQDVLNSALQNGLELVEILNEDNWVAIVLKK